MNANDMAERHEEDVWISANALGTHVHRTLSLSATCILHVETVKPVLVLEALATDQIIISRWQERGWGGVDQT